MATTEKGIYYPDANTNSDFLSIFSTLASSIDSALGEFTYDSGWISVRDEEMLNGWESYNSSSYQVAYRKLGNSVYLRGLIRRGTEGSEMFTLPSGFRPSRGSEIFYCLTSGTISNNGGHKGTRINVLTSGTVSQTGTNTALGNGFISLSNISFATDDN